MDILTSIKDHVNAVQSSTNSDNDCLERIGIGLYAPLGYVVKLYEEQESCLTKAALAVAGVFAMAIALVGALFKKIGECFTSVNKQNIFEQTYSIRNIEILLRALEEICVLMDNCDPNDSRAVLIAQKWGSQIDKIDRALARLPKNFLFRESGQQDEELAKKILIGIAEGKEEYVTFAKTCNLADKLQRNSAPLRDCFHQLQSLGQQDASRRLEQWAEGQKIQIS